MVSRIPQSLNSVRSHHSSVSEFDDLASDAELLAIFVATRNQDSAEKLIRRHSSLVAGLVRRMLHNSSDAEDAFQATFLILLQSASRIRKHGSLASWLYGVAYRTASRIRRQARMRRVAVIDELTNFEIAVEIDPLEKMAIEFQLELLDRELQSLRPMLRDVLIEYHLLGMSVPQIADRFELSNSAVEGRLRRGRAVLRQKLARRGISFSVAVAVAAVYQSRSGAAFAEPWQQSFVQSQFFSQTVATGKPPVDGPLQNLIQGNQVMSSNFVTSKWVSIAAASVTLVGGLCALQFVSTGAGYSSNPFMLIASATEEANSSKPVLIAQENAKTPSASETSLIPLGTSEGSSGSYVLVNPNESTLAKKSSPSATAEKPKSNDTQSGRNQATKIVQFKIPSGPLPNWMTSGGTIAEEENKAREILRNDLRKLVKPDFNNVPLRAVIDTLFRETNIPFIVDEVSISNAGRVTLEDPINFTGLRDMSVQRVLKIILDPLELAYVVEPDYLKITTKDHSSVRVLRTYDLAYLLPSNEKSQELAKLIQTVVPAEWQDNQGRGEDRLTVFGSMLMASCPEEAHLEIEALLFSLSKMSKENINAPSSTIDPATLNSGGGGMGDGMF